MKYKPGDIIQIKASSSVYFDPERVLGPYFVKNIKGTLCILLRLHGVEYSDYTYTIPTSDKHLEYVNFWEPDV